MNSFRFFYWLAKGDKEWSDISSKVQLAYLHKFKPPQTDLQRSFCQYLCQNFFRQKGKIILQEFVAFFLFPLLLIYYFIKGTTSSAQNRRIDAVGEFTGMQEIVPDSLMDAYHIENDVWDSGASLSFKDLNFVFSIAIRKFYSPFFVAKCLAKIARYSFLIRSYSPRAIIVHAEYSFTSSILTAYCELHGIKHINVMHGEKLIYIGWSFFRFTECYVWGKHYRELLKDMGAEPSQFIIEVPPALRINTEINYKQSEYADYKYYLQIYSEDELKSIINSLKFINIGGYSIRYRPHPRFSNIQLLEKYIPRELIEYPHDVDILTSVASCKTAIGYCSTVLYQAYLAGKDVILDDVTYKHGYEQLKDHRYILSQDNIPTLSQKHKMHEV